MAKAIYSLRGLFKIQGLRIAERLQAADAPLRTNSAFLMPTERNTRVEVEVSVDPDVTCIDLTRNLVGETHISGPDRST